MVQLRVDDRNRKRIDKRKSAGLCLVRSEWEKSLLSLFRWSSLAVAVWSTRPMETSG